MYASTEKLEMTIIGICMREPLAVFDAQAMGLTVSSFANEKLGQIFKTITVLRLENKPCDIVALHEHHPNDSYLLAEALTEAPYAQDYKYYFSRLLDAEWRRDASLYFSRLAGEIASSNEDGCVSAKASISESFQKYVVGSKADKNASISSQEAVPRFIEYIENRLEKKARTVPTLMPTLDSMLLGGFHNGNLVVVGARTSTGKTTLAINLFDAAVQSEKRAAFFTLEMSINEILTKIYSLRSGQSTARWINFEPSDAQVAVMTKVSKELHARKFYINDRALKYLETFEAEARILKLVKGVDIIFVDYVGLMHSMSGNFKSRQQELTEITSRLKALAQELQVPIVALAQLNRTGEKSGEKLPEPTLSMLKDSGSLEEDADTVLLIYRQRDDDEKAIGKLIIAKNRNGDTGFIEIKANMAINKFWEV